MTVHESVEWSPALIVPGVATSAQLGVRRTGGGMTGGGGGGGGSGGSTQHAFANGTLITPVTMPMLAPTESTIITVKRPVMRAFFFELGEMVVVSVFIARIRKEGCADGTIPLSQNVTVPTPFCQAFGFGSELM
jgi:hypothetical protein